MHSAIRAIAVALCMSTMGNGAWAQAKNGIDAAAKGARSSAALTGDIPLGMWVEFSFTDAGTAATGCSPADPAGLPCVPSSAGNSMLGAPPPWTFMAPEEGATLTVTDAFSNGDVFEVFDHGVSIGTTSNPMGDTYCGDDPDVCLADSTVSHGSFTLAPGHHSITIVPVASPVSFGAAYFRVEAVESKQDHFLCYKVKRDDKNRGGKDEDKDEKHKPRVVVKNQFGESKFIVLGPELLCVPSSKRVLDAKE